MADVKIPLTVGAAGPVAGATLPERKSAGSAVTVDSYAFDAGTTEALQWCIPFLPSYASGNLTLTVRWYADSATSDEVVWGASVEVITSGAAVNLETGLAWATENFAAASTASSTAHGPVIAVISITNTDSVADGDMLFIRLRRKHDEAGDDMAGDAQFVGALLSYLST